MDGQKSADAGLARLRDALHGCHWRGRVRRREWKLRASGTLCGAVTQNMFSVSCSVEYEDFSRWSRGFVGKLGYGGGKVGSAFYFNYKTGSKKDNRW